MIVRDHSGNYEAIDFRETAPAASFEDMYKKDINLSIFGGLAAGVPGEVRGLEYVHHKYGALPWKEVMQGAIKIARDGFKGEFIRLAHLWDNANMSMRFSF